MTALKKCIIPAQGEYNIDRSNVVLRDIFLCYKWRDSVELVEGHCMPDHIHMCLSILLKYSASHTIGFLKRKPAVRIHPELRHERRMTGLHFWTMGYCVSTVGLDEVRIRKYISEQEKLVTGSR